MSPAPEKKVAYPAYFGVLASAALQLIHVYAPAVKLPPVGVVVLLATAVYALVGYFAPHTHLRPELVSVAPVTWDQGQTTNTTTTTALPLAMPPATGTGATT